MRVLGIDPGSVFTGYGVVEKSPSGGLVHVTDGRIVLGNARDLPQRLLALSEGLKRLFAEFSPSVAAVESVFYARNARSAITLGHARGVALLAAAEFGLKINEYSPSAVKLAVTGNGNAGKEEVGKMVRLLLGRPSSGSPDASDALAVAICHISHSRTAGLYGASARGRLRGA